MSGPDQPFQTPGGEQYPRWDNPPAPVDPQAPLDYPDYPPPFSPPRPPYGYSPPPYQGPAAYPPYPGYGYTDPNYPYHLPPGGTNTMAIASLMSSIMGFPLVFLCYIGIAAWIAGIVLGIVALSQIKETRQPGRGLAIAGIVVGAVALVLSVMAAIVFFTMLRATA